MSIFNIQNEITNNDTITCLDQHLDRNLPHVHPTETDHIIWLGNFNRHHPIWEDKINHHLYELEEYISLLINCLYKYNMVLALPKGILTYQMCTGNWTQPNGVWKTSPTNDPIIHCDILPAICPPEADHLPVVTIIDLLLPQSLVPPTLCFCNEDWPKINNILKAKLNSESPVIRSTGRNNS